MCYILSQSTASGCADLTATASGCEG
jgi:hypothetical protein